MAPITLRSPPLPTDTSWTFQVSPSLLIPSPNRPNDGKLITFTPTSISLSLAPFPSNRVLHADSHGPSAFILVSFGGLRFPEPDNKLSVIAEYINRVFKAGVWLNGVQYRFFHHSNSQLRSRSCFLRQANSDEELDRIIYSLGEFEKIMNVAKRAKRIGLLFSGASIDYILDPRHTTDIPDLKVGDELFSDGCGLISKRLAMQLSRKKGIVFRGGRYTPCVFQIRYLSYKGVVMLHPPLDTEKKHLIAFRSSMKKFTTSIDPTFAVVDYSKPYAFGRLNNDIIVLLSALGISNEALLAKQEEYFRWIREAGEVEGAQSGNVNLNLKAVDFLCCLKEYEWAERALLEGLDRPEGTQAGRDSVSRVRAKIRELQQREVAGFRKNDKLRVRMMVHKSRLLFGVCDPFGVLRPGQIHVRVTEGRRGATTVVGVGCLVVRNPCLLPGDCLKLQAVDHPKLRHLVDCLVFASVGKRAAPSMSSGGDLDGDQFFVCWDPDLVPAKVAESYTYPPNKEFKSNKITRQDLANHFASYNNASLARVVALHQRWARSSPEGAMCSQCQELNALHSQSVDGGRIKIPDKLLTPPEPKPDDEPFIIDLLIAAATKFQAEFTAQQMLASSPKMDRYTAEQTMIQLLKSEDVGHAMSEYEVFGLAQSLARAHDLDLRRHLLHLNFGALTTAQKYAIGSSMGLSDEDEAYMWNSLLRSDIVSVADLTTRNLEGPIRLQRLYSSRVQGLSAFFEYLHQAVTDFTRKVILIRTDGRFAIGIFIRGSELPWDEDPPVSDNVVVCSFMSRSAIPVTTYRPCRKGFRLHCSDNNFQLFNGQRANTFIFMTRPAENSGKEIITSIALQNISAPVQRQIGRVNRTPVVNIEIHVVSNRDRIAHQMFDLRFESVDTEEYIRRLAHKPVAYQLNTWKTESFKWEDYPPDFPDIFTRSEEVVRPILAKASNLLDIIDFAVQYHEEDRLFWAFDALMKRDPMDESSVIICIEQSPQLVYAFMKAFPPVDGTLGHRSRALPFVVASNIIRSANDFGIAALAALEKISKNIEALDLNQYCNLLELTSICVRARKSSEDFWLTQEVFLVLDECRRDLRVNSPAMDYIHRHALAVSFDRAEEAADSCPCDQRGDLTKQRTAPTRARLRHDPDKASKVIGDIRLDAVSPLRLHSHVRLQAASRPEKEYVRRAVLDGVISRATRGEITIDLFYPLPPEFKDMDWNLFDAGSVATSRAMMEAVLRLGNEQTECCRFYSTITAGRHAPEDSNFVIPDDEADGDGEDTFNYDQSLNESQIIAVKSSKEPLSLIWGPPGTGKTTVVVEILRKLLRERTESSRILVTASTHNAVDNVLERFVAINRTKDLLADEQILRVATDQGKVSPALQIYTIDARVGGDVNQNERLKKEAEKRVKQAIIVFTTCTGAGLGTLRKVDFDIVVIDEASQITEPCALIPLVKGCRKAILVGDHVQLRPTVRPMGNALQFDVSLLERLYTGPAHRGMSRTMLDIQYRFPEELAAFPSKEFYENRLRSGMTNTHAVLQRLEGLAFPWSRSIENVICPTSFVPCASEEDMGGASKANTGQADLIKHIVSLLTTQQLLPQSEEQTQKTPISITVLSPYSKQVRQLRDNLPSTVPAFTIDSFQGRESDVIILSTVRCNVSRDIGFVADERRLNVAWTRAKLALIIVGDRATLSEASPLWKRAIESCKEVVVKIPEEVV